MMGAFPMAHMSMMEGNFTGIIQNDLNQQKFGTQDVVINPGALAQTGSFHNTIGSNRIMTKHSHR